MQAEKVKKIIRGFGAIYDDCKFLLKRELESYTIKPSAALLFLTYRCTSRCKTCTIWKRATSKEPEASLDDWKHITDQLYRNGVRGVELFGGDVLLRKDILFNLIEYLKGHDFIVHLPTNCNLLDKESAERFVNSGLDFIYLSMDGVNSNHDRIRGLKGTFERAEEGLNFLLEARRKKGINCRKPKLICNTTVSRHNIEQIDSIARFASISGFEENHFEYVGEMTEEQVDHSIIDGLKPETYYLKGNGSSLITLEQAKAFRNGLRQITQKYNRKDFGITTINIDMLADQDLVNGIVAINKCYMERREVTVDPFGNLVACPFFNNYYLGNLLEQEFEAIWNGKKHKHFRSYQKSGRLEICKHCILSVQRNHSFMAGLKRIYKMRVEQNWAKLFGRNVPRKPRLVGGVEGHNIK
jgi:radical SAM protein with 4Fe4S-binding SPASM domain